MDENNIPQSLHFLIPIAKEWGIGDDGYRDEKLENASNAQLNELLQYYTDQVTDDLNNWLGSPNPVEPQTAEYYLFSSLFMAFEYGEALLRDRLNNNQE